MRWRELALVFLVAAVAFAWPLRAGLFGGERVVFGVDTALAQAPWNQLPGGSDAVANAELADQGMVFYPAYRFALREWSAGGPPLWNPWIYAGAPAIGNPQLGLLDPQVLVSVALGKLFGVGAFDASFAWMAWLRLCFAALGSYALGRALGLRAAGASLAAVGFSCAGFTALWLNHSLGHVTSFLPWVLLAIERQREPRGTAAFLAGAMAFAAAILGGHPETAFHLGLAAGIWALALAREDRRAGLRGLALLALGTVLAAPSWLPSLEYLSHSAAAAMRADLAPRGPVDLFALGLGALCVGLALRRRETARGERPWTVFALALVIAASAIAIVARGEPTSARLLLWPTAFGRPPAFSGVGQFLEQASAFVVAPIAVLALAALVERPSAGTGMQRRGLCVVLGLTALWLCLRAPGLSDLHARIPGIGWAAGVRFALVSSLCLSLLAGEALERASLRARGAAVVAIAVLAAVGLVHTGVGPRIADASPADSQGPDGPDGIVEFVERPRDRLEPGARVAGWIDPGLTVERATLEFEPLPTLGGDSAASPAQLGVDLSPRAWGTAPPGAPDGATHFRTAPIPTQHLSEGRWRLRLVVYGEGGARAGDRVVADVLLDRSPRATRLDALYLGAALLFALGCAHPVARAALLAFALFQGLWFLGGLHPAVERARVFPPTATERELARVLGSRRYLAEPGVMPANTGMVHGLRSIDGYDGMEPASFDGYRAAVLHADAQPLLDFHARHVDFTSPAFRMLGVGALCLGAPIDAPGFSLVAAPAGRAPEASVRAECFVYAATDPLPQALIVTRVRPREEVLADPAAFEPTSEAFLEDGGRFEPRQPATHARVLATRFQRDSVECEVELDGEGLLVLFEQSFPGWRVEVDGRPREILRANSIFRAVALDADSRRVVFRYAPTSWRVGLWIGGLGVLAWTAIAIVSAIRARRLRLL